MAFCLLAQRVGVGAKIPGDERFGGDLKEAVIVLFAAQPDVTHEQLRDSARRGFLPDERRVHNPRETKAAQGDTGEGTCEGCGNSPRILTQMKAAKRSAARV